MNITLHGENGSELEFELLVILPYQEKRYAVMRPIADTEGRVSIFEFIERDENTAEYNSVDEATANAVFAYFTEKVNEARQKAEEAMLEAQALEESQQISAIVEQAYNELFDIDD